MTKIDVKPQSRNVNRHTVRGMAALETSIATDGWIGAITVAADGETFDGSARVEKTAENGMLDEAIVVDSDGTRPIVVRRTDIPTATDERAVRLGIAANRVASLNLDWEPDILAGIAESGIDLSGLFTADEWADVAMPSLPDAGAGGDEFDATPEDGPTRTALGQLWAIGPHRLLVGDCTDAANVARLMGGERAGMAWLDPPYSRDYESRGEKGECVAGGTWGDTLAAVAQCIADVGVWYVKLPWYDAVHAIPVLNPKHFIVWAKQGFGLGGGDFRPQHEILLYGRSDGVSHAGADVGDVWTFAVPFRGRMLHVAETPLALVEQAVLFSSNKGDVVLDLFGGSGTSFVAAHRQGRVSRICELSPIHADVILRRAEAEGMECERVDD